MKLLDELGITQNELARRIGKNPSRLTERNKGKILRWTLREVLNLTAVTGKSLEELAQIFEPECGNN